MSPQLEMLHAVLRGTRMIGRLCCSYVCLRISTPGARGHAHPTRHACVGQAHRASPQAGAKGPARLAQKSGGSKAENSAEYLGGFSAFEVSPAGCYVLDTEHAFVICLQAAGTFGVWEALKATWTVIRSLWD